MNFVRKHFTCNERILLVTIKHVILSSKNIHVKTKRDLNLYKKKSIFFYMKKQNICQY